jgi:hypothetical protein
MDALKMNQLAALLMQQGLAGTAQAPGQDAALRGVLSSTQGTISAEAEKEARKKAEDKESKGIGKALGAAGAVAAAPLTGGTSLTMLPMAMQAGEGLEKGVRGDVGDGLADVGMAAAGAYGAHKGMTEPKLKESPVLDNAAAATEPAGMPMPKPENPKGASPVPFDLSKLNFDMPAAATAGIATAMAGGGRGKGNAPMQTAPQAPGGGVRPARNGVGERPMTVAEAVAQGFGPREIKELQRIGRVEQNDNTLMRGLLAGGAAGLAGGALRNA